jgi:hypothetical protein
MRAFSVFVKESYTSVARRTTVTNRQGRGEIGRWISRGGLFAKDDGLDTR